MAERPRPRPVRRRRRALGALVAVALAGAAACSESEPPPTAEPPELTEPGTDDQATGTDDQAPGTTSTTVDLAKREVLRTVVTVPGADAEQLLTTAELLRTRLGAAGARDIAVAVVGHEVFIEVRSALEPGEVFDLTSRDGQLSLRPVVATQSVCPTSLAARAVDATGPLSLRNRALGCVQVGPGADVEVASAAAVIVGNQWAVNATATGNGLAAINSVVGACYQREATCPTGRVALVVDGQVESVTSPLDGSYADPNVQILGDFDGIEAQRLAMRLSFGAPPAPLESVVPPVPVEVEAVGRPMAAVGGRLPAVTVEVHFGARDGDPGRAVGRLRSALALQVSDLGATALRITVDELRSSLTVHLLEATDAAASSAAVQTALGITDATRVRSSASTVVGQPEAMVDPDLLGLAP